MNKHHYVLIMAGGVGSRFWPQSTPEYPKQFHDMLGAGVSLLQKTFQRFAQTIPVRNIYILTNERYTDLVLEQLPQIAREQVIPEPAMRNTAPCILLSSLKISKMDPDAVMVVAPSDHWIEDEAAFQNDISICLERCAGEDILMTLGIKPDFPNTGYGYIEYEPGDEPVRKVIQFREKPDYQTARKFLEKGNFLWNAGIFIWSVESVLKAFEKYSPSHYDHFKQGMDQLNTENEDAFLKEKYPEAENISVDYAIMEPASNIFVLPAHFDWNDLGTWGSLYNEVAKDEAGNAVINARALIRNGKGNMVSTEKGKLVVIEGLNDYIVVDRKDVLLIYPKAEEQQIKAVAAEVKSRFGE
ncbi:mannose-1-phosphate guanylyltransferase [Robertkochia aurantiaca]|uniref:mannose-1-phosphate guanylyltransferase n=1 Tax=Robertkochia aurantiaca TaxID=2873700 RepID=UPI001CCF9057|nr:mannose-1-phosphate guanylyltransferase [Robertkochia sp. 3YJGBD-33]